MTKTSFSKLVPERRAAIIQAILAEVAEHGFDGASVAGIAERAGGSKASLFYYFKDRDEMIATAVAAVFDETLGLGDTDAPPLPLPSTAAAFWTTFEGAYRALAAGLQADPVRARFGRVWLDALSRGQVPDVLRPFAERTRAVFEFVVSTGVACGAIRSDVPRALLLRALPAFALAADDWMAEALLQGSPVDLAVTPVLALLRAAFGGEAAHSAPAIGPSTRRARV